jgi:3-hydroxyacyl-CoA dehydrogenase/3-hydroxy-2-methylbutyryl-CoA dehydrogenase
LGLATVECLIQNGAYVAILDLQDKNDLARRLGSKARFFKIDVSKSEDIKSAVDEIVSWKKEVRANIGGVICCAGILGPAKV